MKKNSRPVSLDIEQRMALFDVIDELETVRTPEQFLACTTGTMQRIFPHGGLVAGIGNFVEPSIYVKPEHLLLHNFAIQVIESLVQPDGGIRCPVVDRWREVWSPVLIDFDKSVEAVLGAERVERNRRWLAKSREHGHRNVAGHGLMDLDNKLGSFFCFVRIPEELGDKHAYLLNRLVPHFHVALGRAFGIWGANEAKAIGSAVPGAGSSSCSSALGSNVEVIFIEDDAVVRHANEQALRLAGLQAQAFADAEQALQHVVAGYPGVVVSDFRLPGGDGMALLSDVLRIDRDIPVILVTGHGDVPLAVEAMRAGAFDFIEKPARTERLLGAVRRALEKRRLALSSKRSKPCFSLSALTPREREIAYWVGLGKANADIAQITSITEDTVKRHLTHVFEKLGISNRAQLIRNLAEHEMMQSPTTAATA